MSNSKFVKLFRVNGTEVLVRATSEIVDGKQQALIIVHCYFEEYIAMGYMPEAISRFPICCTKHLLDEFQKFDGERAKQICEISRKAAKGNQQKIMDIKLNHN